MIKIIESHFSDLSILLNNFPHLKFSYCKMTVPLICELINSLFNRYSIAVFVSIWYAAAIFVERLAECCQFFAGTSFEWWADTFVAPDIVAVSNWRKMTPMSQVKEHWRILSCIWSVVLNAGQGCPLGLRVATYAVSILDLEERYCRSFVVRERMETMAKPPIFGPSI